jgi:hypothetical protein
MVMNLRVPLKAGKFLSSCATDGFSGRAHLHGVTVISSYDVRKSGCVFFSDVYYKLGPPERNC